MNSFFGYSVVEKLKFTVLMMKRKFFKRNDQEKM